MTKLVLLLLTLCLAAIGAAGKPGIKGIVVFGDSLSDSGNAALWDEGFFTWEGPGDVMYFPSPPYYSGRASNGPTWVEIVAAAYGYRVRPALEGGTNFAFIGAETGTGLSDQFTPNLHAQIRMYRQAVEDGVVRPAMPWQLFVIWAGVNDFQRILNTDQRPVEPEDIQRTVANLAEGIRMLNGTGARLFLVPNMPPVHLTPYAATLPGEVRLLLARLQGAFNEALERALARLEQDRKITILRLDTDALYSAILRNPTEYGLTNVSDPAFNLGTGEVASNAHEYLSWDGFHPTVSGHALIAQKAMDVIPIGSWWGRAVGRGPDGAALLGMGRVRDEKWPWIYSYSLQDGVWLWAHEPGGAPGGFYAHIPKSTKWIWLNAMSGWYYDFEAARWMRVPLP